MEQRMDLQIEHNRGQSRFETVVDGAHCTLEYTLADGGMVIHSTRVPPEAGGRGVAGELVRTALDHARGKGWKVVPLCSYAESWVRRHPEYQGLVA